MTRTMSASSQKDDALLRQFERLEREIAQQFRDDPDFARTPALRLKLMALMDDLDRITRDLRAERDGIRQDINGIDGAQTATDAYRMGSRLGQSK